MALTPATKLSVYQEALRLLGDVRLAALTDDVEARYALGDAWDGAIAFVLRQAAWRFALKTAALGAGGAPLPGFSTSYARPADWCRTHALFKLSGALECPIDIREQGILFSSNTLGAVIRFVSSDYTDPALAPWPEHFAKLAAAYLAFTAAARIRASRDAQVKASQLFSSLLPEAVSHDAIPEDPWLKYQLDGRLQRGARKLLLDGYWRFALTTAEFTDNTSPAPGYAHAAAIPADWLKTQAAFLIAGGRECPFDLREDGAKWSTAVGDFFVRYVSSTLGLDSTKWPEPFQKAMLAFLDAEDAMLNGDKDAAEADKAYQGSLAQALLQCSQPEDVWWRFQRDGRFLRAAGSVLLAGYWRFALKLQECQASDNTDPNPLTPWPGYPFAVAIPADWARTHAAYVQFGARECPLDIREDGTAWSSEQGSFVVRYVSATLGLDSTKWPAPYIQAVLARLEEDEAVLNDEKDQQADTANYKMALTDALDQLAEPENPWWRFQRDGRFRTARDHVLEQGRWRFAIRTITMNATVTVNADGTVTSSEIPTDEGPSTVSPGYSNAFPKPPDWLRTIWVYRNIGPSLSNDPGNWIDVDYRDEQGFFHADYSPLQIRYLTDTGYDSTKWPAAFREATLSWLEYQEARSNPKLAGIAAAKLKFFEAQLDTAEAKDDANEQPRVNRVGRFVRGRSGYGGGQNLEQGWR